MPSNQPVNNADYQLSELNPIEDGKNNDFNSTRKLLNSGCADVAFLRRQPSRKNN